MSTATTPQDDRSLQLEVQTRVHASLDDTFAALLEELGPANLGYADAPMPMVLEAWPGGRWYRDLGNQDGHWWGTVQAIRRPTLLEICGPMMMSFGVASNIQYRLTADGHDTLLTFRHSALGLFPAGYRDALTQGWSAISRRIQARFPSP
ncbi:SRPBCC family protein [Gemmatimonas sp.]